MPLVRVEVRNEYSLCMPELYTQINREDPKAVLDGVAAAGLVGILRQLGDLAEFAAEVFHGLQEQVLITSSRSHKLVERVHNIESALPPLEKAILGQRSHLHFAYTARSKWHTQLRTEQNHFIYSNLPCCIMDSYEECNDPPCLHNLDKFDTGGPGSCFRKYSDPTYFKRSSAGSYEEHLQSIPKGKKKKRYSSRYRGVTQMHGKRRDFGSSDFKEKDSPFQDLSRTDVPQKFGVVPEVDHLTSSDSRNGLTYIECISRPSHSTQSEDSNVKELSYVSNVNQDSYLNSASFNESFYNSNLAEDNRSMSAYITWDEKLEIIDSTGRMNEPTEIPCATETMNPEVMEDRNSRVVDHIDFELHDEQLRPTSVFVRGQHDEIESETDYYVDALNNVESESEKDLEFHTNRELKQNSNVNNKDLDEMFKESHLDDNSMNSEFRVPEPTSHKSHMEATGSSNIEDHEYVMKLVPIGSTDQHIPEKLESEEVERYVTNTETVACFTEPTSQPSWSTSGGQTAVSNPVMFWTNGGLLGLEPSKPPDFGAAGPDHVEETKSNEIQHPGQQNPINGVQDDSVNSSRMFEFRNRLLVNGFRKQMSLVGDENLARSVKTDVPENTSIQKGRQTVTGMPFREQFISPSSPPLEHMKISFQPIDGFETSKLKLAFPDGNNNNGSNGVMFPSFQLVPEPALSLHEFVSDSDDDTFCRSSPYASDDDCCSNCSESNSEQWDSSETPRIKDQEFDDAESVSSSLVNGTRFQQGSLTEHGCLFDIPNFDIIKASQNQVTNDLSETTQPPPPLPPVEWRGIKPSSPEPTPPQQFKPVSAKPDNVVETDILTVKPKPDWENLHVQNRSSRRKVVEEKDDFLQQIRRKARNLRPISAARPTTPAGPTTLKVTAILEKATSIRQVVGSDDGEDNWSDT